MSFDQPNTIKIVVLSGPSGSGKSTIVNRLIDEAPVPLMKAVSATTRPPRKGEIHGEDYYFLSADEFQQQRNSGGLVEAAEVFGAGYWYGTLRSELERIHEAGGWVFLEIDVEGALNIMEQYPDTISIFLTTPSEEEFERRLRNRGTESEEVIARRVRTAQQELKQADRYKHIVVNDDLDRAVREISNILSTQEAERHA